MFHKLRVVIVGLLIAALLIPAVVVAQMEIPTVITADAYIFLDAGAGTNRLWVEVWCNPNDYVPDDGNTSIYAQYRQVGADTWIPFTNPQPAPLHITSFRMFWFYVDVPIAVSYEVRGAAVYNAASVYGNIFTLHSPQPESPYVSTGKSIWTSDTTAQITAYGNPGAHEWANLYVQYREQGETTWDETHKEYITDWATRQFDLTGLDILVNTEVRAALDYPGGTIYGEIVLIEDTSAFDLACEYQPEEGSGNITHPYIITDICELSWVRNQTAAYYELGNDIDATMTRYWNWDGSKHLGFAPIGGTFTGNFDGKGYTITGLYINRPTTDNVGLFSIVATGSGGEAGTKDKYIKNLRFTSPTIIGQQYVGVLAGDLAGAVKNNLLEHLHTVEAVHVVGGSVSGRERIGGLAGQSSNAAEWRYCSYQGSISQHTTGSTIAVNMGGLVGDFGTRHVPAEIYRCYADITMSTLDRTRVGGLAGYSAGIMEESFALGSINTLSKQYEGVGGIFGRTDWNAAMINCFARVTIVGTTAGSYGEYIGGFGGRVLGSSTTIDKVYSTGAVSGGKYRGGLLADSSGTVTHSLWDTQTSGQASSDGGTGKTTAQMKTKSTFTDAGWDFNDVWSIDPTINDGYPHLQWAGYLLEVTTDYPANVSSLSFQAEGTITDTNPDAFRRGFVYLQGTSDTPDFSNTIATIQQTGSYGTGKFILPIPGLQPQTPYRVRAFAENDRLFAWGNTITVVTLSDPVVVTVRDEVIAEHLPTWRRLFGFVEYDGGVYIEVRFQYGTSNITFSHATPWQDKFKKTCPQRGFQTGDEFFADISSLTQCTTYYYRAQVWSEDVGIGSGEILMFTTSCEYE